MVLWATKYKVVHLANYVKSFKGNRLMAGGVWRGLDLTTELLITTAAPG